MNPGHATLAAEIGLAEPREVAFLPEIERRACDLFLAIPAAHGLGAHLRVAMKFTGGIAS